MGKKKENPIFKNLFDSLKFIFIAILIIFLSILLAGTGIDVFLRFLRGEVTNDFAEIYGEKVTDPYFRAVYRQYCSHAKDTQSIYSCAEQVIRQFKQKAYLAKLLGIDYSEDFLKKNLYQAIRDSIEQAKKTDPSLIVLSKEELEWEIRRRFEENWNASPMEFKKDQLFAGSQSVGRADAFLLMPAIASDDDYETLKKAKSMHFKVRIAALSSSQLTDYFKNKVKVSEKEIQEEFEKENKKKKEKDKEEPKLTDLKKKTLRKKIQRKKIRQKIEQAKKEIENRQKQGKLSFLDFAKYNVVVYTVSDLDLFSIDHFTSDETKPKKQTYRFGDEPQWIEDLLNAPLKKVLGPLKKGGVDYYYSIEERKEVPFEEEFPPHIDPKTLSDAQKKRFLLSLYFIENIMPGLFDTIEKNIKLQEDFRLLRAIPQTKKP